MVVRICWTIFLFWRVPQIDVDIFDDLLLLMNYFRLLKILSLREDWLLRISRPCTRVNVSKRLSWGTYISERIIESINSCTNVRADIGVMHGIDFCQWLRAYDWRVFEWTGSSAVGTWRLEAWVILQKLKELRQQVCVIQSLAHETASVHCPKLLAHFLWIQCFHWF